MSAPAITIPPGSTVNIYFQLVNTAGLAAKLDALAAKVDQLTSKENIMAATLDDVLKLTQDEAGTVASAVTLIEGAAALIKANASDPAKIQAIADQMTKNSAALAAAVAANPLPTPPPAPVAP